MQRQVKLLSLPMSAAHKKECGKIVLFRRIQCQVVECNTTLFFFVGHTDEGQKRPKLCSDGQEWGGERGIRSSSDRMIAVPTWPSSSPARTGAAPACPPRSPSCHMPDVPIVSAGCTAAAISTYRVPKSKLKNPGVNRNSSCRKKQIPDVRSHYIRQHSVVVASCCLPLRLEPATNGREAHLRNVNFGLTAAHVFLGDPREGAERRKCRSNVLKFVD